MGGQQRNTPPRSPIVDARGHCSLCEGTHYGTGIYDCPYQCDQCRVNTDPCLNEGCPRNARWKSQEAAAGVVVGAEQRLRDHFDERKVVEEIERAVAAHDYGLIACFARPMIEVRKRVHGVAQSESGEIERAYQMLEVYGVPRERAKNLANGIDVLATRIQREEGFERMMRADAKRFRWIAAHREQFKAMLADDHKTGDILSAELQEAMEGWNG